MRDSYQSLQLNPLSVRWVVAGVMISLLVASAAAYAIYGRAGGLFKHGRHGRAMGVLESQRPAFAHTSPT